MDCHYIILPFFFSSSSIIACNLPRASFMLSSYCIYQSFSTASLPSSSVPTSLTSSVGLSISSSIRSLEICECSARNLVILSCVLIIFRRLCSTPMNIPLVRTGWITIVPLGTIKEYFADTASGPPIEWLPPGQGIPLVY